MTHITKVQFIVLINETILRYFIEVEFDFLESIRSELITTSAICKCSTAMWIYYLRNVVVDELN